MGRAYVHISPLHSHSEGGASGAADVHGMLGSCWFTGKIGHQLLKKAHGEGAKLILAWLQHVLKARRKGRLGVVATRVQHVRAAEKIGPRLLTDGEGEKVIRLT